MKQVRSFCAAVLFILALSIPAFAGDVLSPAIADPGSCHETQCLPPAPAPGETGLQGVNSTSDITTVDAITALTVRFCAQWLLVF
jgi:hypothetical protein